MKQQKCSYNSSSEAIVRCEGDVFKLLQTVSAMSNRSSSCFCLSNSCNKSMASLRSNYVGKWLNNKQRILGSCKPHIEEWSPTKRLSVLWASLLTMWFLVLCLQKLKLFIFKIKAKF